MERNIRSRERNGRKYGVPLAVVAVVMLASGCADQRQRGIDESDAGQILGGVAGAAAGSQVGGGPDPEPPAAPA